MMGQARNRFGIFELVGDDLSEIGKVAYGVRTSVKSNCSKVLEQKSCFKNA